MSHFSSDIPFMDDEERKENGIKIPKDTKDKRFPIDVYIYHLDLNVEKPVLEKIPARLIRDGGDAQVIYSVGPDDYEVWHSSFDTLMLGSVYEPLDNVVELIVKRDSMTGEKAHMLIQNYCCKKAAILRKKLDMFHRGIGVATEAYVRDGWNVGQKGGEPSVSLRMLQSLNRTYVTEGIESKPERRIE